MDSSPNSFVCIIFAKINLIQTEVVTTKMIKAEVKAATTTFKMEALYREAANVIQLAKSKKGSIKGLCFASSYGNKKKLYALVCQTVKYKSTLLAILRKLDEHDSECMIEKSLQLVLAYDILFGKGIRCGGRLGAFAREKSSRLFEILEDFQSNGPRNIENTSITPLPRYVRVNTLKNTVNEVVDSFVREGWTFIENQVKELDTHEFTSDVHIPEVLVFCTGTDLHSHPLYINGNIVLQDKASCLPAFLLKPKSKSTVIDACAAPGNKTTHLSAVMRNRGRIFAFDLDRKRLEVLKKQTKKVAAENVDAIHQDFLKTNPSEDRFVNVKYILLDPSCSGSGMVSRMDQLLEDPNENMEKLRLRLESLSKFQYAMLCHALSFPRVEKVAYSTCSVHQQENEVVVERALKRFGGKFYLAQLLPSWEHRGEESFNCGSFCLRASPEIDRTNGFFVAIFKRRKIESLELDSKSVEHSQDASKHVKNRKSKKRKSPKENADINEDLCCEKEHFHVSNGKRKRRKRQQKIPVTCL